jgi:2-oxoglutarate ferredoxin oxidoreductase subunit alpha
MEDELASSIAITGASWGGQKSMTATSGPGFSLMQEHIGYAFMTETPTVLVNIQRGGPSTGLPTKTEQSDLLQMLFGRNGESPVPILAAASPKDCFDVALEACRIATRYMVPVMLLSDGYIANGSEPWRLPRVEDLPDLRTDFHTAAPAEGERYDPYLRDEESLVRPWVVPGTPGLEHRIGGLERQDGTGNVSYDPENHEHMTWVRAEKVERIARELPPTEVFGDAEGGDLLVVGWGSTEGAITGAVNAARNKGLSVSRVHLRYLNPLPADLGDVLGRFRHVLLPEMNSGQLALLLRARYLVDVQSYTKVQGRPFFRSEIYDRIQEILSHG